MPIPRRSSSKDFPFISDLLHKIKDGTITLKELLEEKYSFNLIKRNSRLITNFIIEHKEEYIDILLSPENGLLQKSAIKALGGDNRAIVKEVATSEKIHEFGKNITDGDKLGNLPRIVDICVSECPEYINETFDFVLNLCKFADNSSVLYMFERLLQPSDKLSMVHLYFKMVDLPNTVATEGLNSECNVEKQIGLINILILCLHCPNLEESSTNTAALDFMKKCSESNDTYVQSLVWKFAEEAVNKDNSDVYASTFLDKSIHAITTIEPNIYRQYQVEAIKFLMKLINIRPETCTEFSVNSFIESLTNIFKEYPSHSILLTAIFEFAKDGIENSYIHQSIINSFIPSVVSVLECDDVPRTQHAFCIDFMRMLKRVSENDSIIYEELTQETRKAFSYASDYETLLDQLSDESGSDCINELMESVDRSRTRPIISSQDF